MHEKATLGNPVPVNCYIFYLLLSFASMSCFYILNVSTLLGNWFFFFKFNMIYKYQQFVYLVCMRILNTFLPLKSLITFAISKFYNLVCNNIFQFIGNEKIYNKFDISRLFIHTYLSTASCSHHHIISNFCTDFNKLYVIK